MITERSMWTHFEGLRTILFANDFLRLFNTSFKNRKNSRFWNLKKRKIRRPILEHWWQLATIASTATGTYAPKLRRTAEAQRTRSLGLSYKLCAVIPVAGQRTHGTTLRAQLPRWQHRGQSLRSLWLLVDIVGHRTGGTAWVTRFSLLK